MAGGAISLLVSSFIKRSDKIDNMASKKDVENSLKEAKSYTDKSIIDHEKVHKEISLQYAQIQSDLNIIKEKLMGKNK